MLATRTPQQRMSNKRATATANVAKPASLPSGLHRAAGNQAAQRQLESRLVQAKLSVNQPGDKFELEADRVADQVMRMPDPSRDGPPRIQRVCTHCQNEMGAARVQRVCRECEEELHRKAGDGARDTPAVSGHLESQIASLRGGGQPLLPSTRSFFERRFGRDFSDVRVHASGRAAETACSVNALAYTAGRDIVFAPAQYSPETERGKRLLAHELSHTVQQGQARESSAPAVQRMGDPAKVPAGLACPVASDSPPTSIVEVLFPNSVTVLTAAQKRAIQSFAVSWNASGASADVRVDGYASPAGTDELNWRLSCERAQAVSVELSTPSAPGIPAVPPSKLSVFAPAEPTQTALIVGLQSALCHRFLPLRLPVQNRHQFPTMHRRIAYRRLDFRPPHVLLMPTMRFGYRGRTSITRPVRVKKPQILLRRTAFGSSCKTALKVLLNLSRTSGRLKSNSNFSIKESTTSTSFRLV